MDAWLAEPSVTAALHVKTGTSGMQYVKTATDLRPLYSELIQQYQMLIYSGDTDGCVPYVGTETWTRGLNYSVTDDWHQWMGKPDDVHAMHKAGYAVTYDKFQFVTVNGAGHMVPQFQPGFAKTMFEKFLADEKF
jgi:carboxypeptidase C (cathepsin A)